MALVKIDESRCKGCGLCVRVCPKQVLGFGEDTNDAGYRPAKLVKEGCIGCTSCALMCPDCCITVER